MNHTKTVTKPKKKKRKKNNSIVNVYEIAFLWVSVAKFLRIFRPEARPVRSTATHNNYFYQFGKWTSTQYQMVFEWVFHWNKIVKAFVYTRSGTFNENAKVSAVNVKLMALVIFNFQTEKKHSFIKDFLILTIFNTIRVTHIQLIENSLQNIMVLT